MTVAVSDHLAVLRRLLHDPNDVFWSEADKIAYVSDAMQQRDLVTGQNRTLLSVTLAAGTDTYAFAVAAVNNERIFDVVGINLIYGSNRIVLDTMSFSELNAQWRTYTAWRDRPYAWCRYGPQSVIFGPNPAQAYVTEWDCSIQAAAVTLTTATDPLLPPYTAAVPFWAAHLAKLNERMYDEADEFKGQFWEKINEAIASRAGMVPTMYGGR